VLLSIIIINYNTPLHTLEALASVFRELKLNNYEVIVLDNASGDNSVETIKASFGDKIHLIASKTNTGFAKGNNLAIKQAKGEYLLLLNPDTLVQDHAIDELLSFAEMTPSAEIWGGRTLFADGSLNPFSCWQRQTLWSLLSQAIGLSSLFRKSSFFNPEGIGGWDREGIREVDIVSGCFLLIKREFWLELKGFDSDFFMYGEEADLCLRAREKGASPVVTSKATIIHHGGASEKILTDKLVKLIKAKMLLICRHFTPLTIPIGVILFTCWPLSRYAVHGLLSLIGRRLSIQPRKVWGEVWRRRKEWLPC